MATIKYKTAGGQWALLSTLGVRGKKGKPGPQGIPGPDGPVLSGYRNRITNGDFSINQRVFTSLTSYTWGFDRWYHSHAGSGTTTWSAMTATPGELPEGAKFYSRVVTASHALPGDYGGIAQKVEGARTFSGKTVTLSFYARANGAMKVGAEIVQNMGSGGSASIFTFLGLITTTTYWARYSVTATVPPLPSSGVTMGADSRSTLLLYTSAGSDMFGRVGPVGAQNGTVDLWGFQIEEGSVATPFEQRPYAEELRECMRFFQRWQQPPLRGVTNGPNNFSRMGMQLPVVMRAKPTVGMTGQLPWYDAAVAGVITSITSDYSTPTMIEFDGAHNVTSAQGRMCLVYQGGTSYLDLSAEP